MDYQIENPSPVKIKVSVAASGDEVDSALNKTRDEYRANVQLPGFRKGKASPALVEKRFRNEIFDQARESLMQEEMGEILQKENFSPISNISLSKPDDLQRGQDFAWSFEFEVLPEFELPVYEGLEETLASEKVSPQKIDEILHSLSGMWIKKVKVSDIKPAVDGQIANVDIDILKDGEPVMELGKHGHEFEVGSREILPEIEELVKGAPVGNVAQKEIAFPEDFPDPLLAGQTHTIRVKVNSLFNIDDSVWQSRWQGEDGEKRLAALKDLIKSSQQERLDNYNRGVTEKRLLNQLLKQTDFITPDFFIQFENRRIISELEEELKLKGVSLASLGANLKDFLAKSRQNAEEAAREMTLLLAIARKENLVITDEELSEAIYNYSLDNNVDFNTALNNLRENGMLPNLRNRLLADKAMDYIYDKSKITVMENPEADKSDAANCEAEKREAPALEANE